jgi:hypothetical protein
MAERRNSIVCTFDPATPKIAAHDIHGWIHDTLRIPEKTVKMIEIECAKRHVYIKLAGPQFEQAVLGHSCGPAEYRNNNGEISILIIAMAGMGEKKYGLRTYRLKCPVNPEVNSCPIWKVVTIEDEMWSRTYVQTCRDKRHTAGYNDADPKYPVQFDHRREQGTLSYEGQPLTCYGCGENGHMYQVCPKKQRREKIISKDLTSTYANVAAHSTPQKGNRRMTQTNEHHPPNR